MDAVVFTMLSTLNPSQVALFAIIMWSLWKRKNLKLWQQKVETGKNFDRAIHQKKQLTQFQPHLIRS